MTCQINLWAYLFLFSLLTLQAYVLFWATMMITRGTVKLGTLLAGAGVMAVYDIFVDLARVGVMPQLLFLDNPFVVLLTSLTLVIVLFRPANLWGGARIVGYFYLLAFISAGAGLAAQSLSHQVWAGPVVSSLSILLIGEIGWGIVQQWVWHKTLLVPIEVTLGTDRIVTTALLDTGNSLRDPLTRTPVVILDASLFAAAHDEALHALCTAVRTQELDQISAILGESFWATRVRLIPFSSLGTSKGILIGLRPDSLKVNYGGESVVVGDAIVGIHGRPLSDDGSYGALIHPELLQRAVQGFRN